MLFYEPLVVKKSNMKNHDTICIVADAIAMTAFPLSGQNDRI